MKSIKNYIFLIKNFYKYGKKYTILLFLISLLSPIATVIDTYLIKFALDAITTQGNVKTIIIFLASYVFFATFMYLVSSLFVKFSSVELINIENRMNLDIYNQSIRTDYKYCDSSDYYELYSWSVSGYYSRSLSAVRNIASFLGVFLNIIAIISIMLTTDFVIIFFSIINVCLVTIFNIINKNINYKKSEQMIRVNRMNSYIHRIFYIPEYAVDIRISGLIKKILNKYEENRQQRVAITKKYLNKNLVVNFLIRFIPMSISIITIIYLINKAYRGSISYGDFALLFASSQNLSNELLTLTNLIPNVIEQGLYSQKMIEFNGLSSTIENKIGGMQFESNSVNIFLKDISFSYDGKQNIINKLNLKISSGEKIAIVGRNGAGKSTLAKLLLRLYDVDSGEIIINNHNINEYDIRQLRLRIGVAMQKTNLYAFSLKDNIILNTEKAIYEDSLESTIKNLGLSITREQLEKNVTKEFDNDGIVFSGGEMQKIALSRVMIEDYPIVLLDEPTASLDPISEKVYMSAVLNQMKNSTVVMIAHRLSTIKDFDRIIVMEKGQIIEEGNHLELMNKKGAYYEMFSAQCVRREETNE